MRKKIAVAIVAIVFVVFGLSVSEASTSASTVCGNGLCESGESYLTCSDCPKPYDYYNSKEFVCIKGDKTCTQACGEIGQSCISRSCSWGGSCGAPDGQPSEWCNSNPSYPGTLCDVAIGSGVAAGFCYCGPAPSVTTTPQVKSTAVCGNGVCEVGESYLTCSDCPKPISYYSSTPAPTGGTNATVTEPACYDSDSGLNLYVKGTCKDKNAYWYDSCSGDINGVSSLAEMYCDYKSNACVESAVPCPNGCSDGKCIILPVCGNGLCESGESYLTCSDCPKPINYYSSVKEQIKCVFANSENSMQKCYSDRFGCSGVGTCVTDVYGDKGTKLTWKSSCGGYAYTTIDGESEYAEFKCEAVCGNGVCESGESYLTCSDCPKPIRYYAVCGNGICDVGESYLTCSDCPKPINYYSSELKEQVKCVFANSNSPQKCYSANANADIGQFGCTGVGTCVADVYGDKGTKLTWKSSCGGYAYTVIDGENEYAEFKCEAVCGNGICEPGESYLTCSDCPKPYDYAYSLCGNGRCEAGEDYKSCPNDCLNPFIYPGVSYTIAILPGWNLISNPLFGVSPGDVLSKFEGDCGETSGWHYSPKSGYEKPTDFETKKGYWLKASGACKVVLTAKTYPNIELYVVGLETGWNQIGAPSERTSFESVKGDCDITKGPYWYDPSSKQYVKASVLEPTRGYFVKVAKPCTLKAGVSGEAGMPPLPPDERYSSAASATSPIYTSSADTQVLVAATIPEGTPDYGASAKVSFDSPVQSISVLGGYENSVALSDSEMQRYINIAGQLSCEYCCGAPSIIDSKGRAACGCAHSGAMRGLGKWLIKNQPGMSDDQILEELGKWKTLFFPKDSIKKAFLLKANNIPFNYANLQSNKYKNIATTTGAQVVANLDSLPSQVGSC